MQRLHPPVQDLGKAGHIRYFSHGHIRLTQRAGRPPGRQDLEAGLDHCLSKLHDASFVSYAEYGAFHDSLQAMSQRVTSG